MACEEGQNQRQRELVWFQTSDDKVQGTAFEEDSFFCRNYSAFLLHVSWKPLLTSRGCCCNINPISAVMVFCESCEMMTQQYIAAVFRAGTTCCKLGVGGGKVLHGGRIRNDGEKCCFKHIAITRPRTGSEWMHFSKSSALLSQIAMPVTYLARLKCSLLLVFHHVFHCGFTEPYQVAVYSDLSPSEIFIPLHWM